eukprot:scaffold4634_cov22-Tisochrysis_lutea.AAC.2
MQRMYRAIQPSYCAQRDSMQGVYRTCTTGKGREACKETKYRGQNERACAGKRNNEEGAQRNKIQRARTGKPVIALRAEEHKSVWSLAWAVGVWHTFRSSPLSCHASMMHSLGYSLEPMWYTDA